jgi:hypothetical protein
MTFAPTFGRGSSGALTGSFQRVLRTDIGCVKPETGMSPRRRASLFVKGCADNPLGVATSNALYLALLIGL